MILRYIIRTETVENLWTQTTHANSYAVDAATGHRIAGSDGATPDDARSMVRHWYQGAKEAEAESPVRGSIPITRCGAWPEGSRQCQED